MLLRLISHAHCIAMSQVATRSLYATVHANTLRGGPNGCSDMLTWNGMSDNTTEKPQHHGKKQMLQMCEVRDLIMDAPKS